MSPPAVGRIRVLLIHDEVLVRTGLRMLLESWPEVKVVGDTAKTADGLALVSREQPDIVLFDAGSDGDEATLCFLSELLRGMGEGRVIVLVGEQDPDVRLKAVQLGAMGVVCKDKAVEEFRKAIAKVSAGEAWLDRSSAASLIQRITQTRPIANPDPDKARFDSLTQRERQVATLICQGLQNVEIGARLFISTTTVRHHLTAIFSKLEVSNRLELIIFLYRNKFVELPH